MRPVSRLNAPDEPETSGRLIARHIAENGAGDYHAALSNRRLAALYRREIFELIKASTPLVIAQLAQNTLAFVDTLMVGRLGNEALAGIAVGSTTFQFVLFVLSGVIFGVNPIVSQAIGAGQTSKATQALRQGLWVGLLMFLPAFALYWNSYPILIGLGQQPETALASSEYLKAISWGLLPALWIMAFRGYLEGNADTLPIMVVAILGIGANVFLNYALMFGKFGCPALGLVGTGYASSIVYTLGFLLLFAYTQRQYCDDLILPIFTEIDKAAVVELFKVGGPIGLTLGFEIGMFSTATLAMGQVGSNQLAAHQIALQTGTISFMVPLGIAIATSVRVGHATGAQELAKARVAGNAGILLCCTVMGVFAILFWLLPRSIVAVYIDPLDPKNLPVVEFAVGFLAIAAWFQIFDGLQVAASNALRGLKDTTAAMVLTMIAYWGLGIPACFWFREIFDSPGKGLWWGMTVGLAAAAIMLSFRFQRQINRLEQAANES